MVGLRTLRVLCVFFPIGIDDDLLTAAVAVVVADVDPAGLHDELVVGEVVADVHVGLGQGDEIS